MRSFFFFILLIAISECFLAQGKGDKKNALIQVATIKGSISPKSIVHNGKGLFFAQNMMYRHTVTVYNRDFKLVKTLSDKVTLSEYGYTNYKGVFKGGPVECAFSHNGKYAWVSNYSFSGGTNKQFVNPGCDGCNSANKYDDSFVYKINTATLSIEEVIKVGAIPKFLAASPDNKKIVVSNWSSGDVSIIDVDSSKEVKRVKVGAYPRGVEINSNGTIAYVAVMGATKVATINLQNYAVSYIENIGKNPRHLCLSSDDKHLYVSLNGEGKIGKVELSTGKIVKVKTGKQPRSMELSSNDSSLFVVNYSSNTMSKVDAITMKVLTTNKTKSKPIGITIDNTKEQVWVACYGGYIQVFQDGKYDQKIAPIVVDPSLEVTPIKTIPEETTDSVFYEDTIAVVELFAQRLIPRGLRKEKERPIQFQQTYQTPQDVASNTGVFDTNLENTEPYYDVIENDTLEISTVLLASRISNRKPYQNKTAPLIQSIEPIDPIVPKVNTATKDLQIGSPTGNYYVVIGGFSKEKNAINLIDEYEKKGYAPFTHFNPIKSLNYVCVAGFDMEEEAQLLRDELKSSGTDCWTFNRLSIQY